MSLCHLCCTQQPARMQQELLLSGSQPFATTLAARTCWMLLCSQSGSWCVWWGLCLVHGVLLLNSLVLACMLLCCVVVQPGRCEHTCLVLGIAHTDTGWFSAPCSAQSGGWWDLPLACGVVGSAVVASLMFWVATDAVGYLATTSKWQYQLGAANVSGACGVVVCATLRAL